MLQNFTDWRKLADYLELDENQRQHILERPHFSLNLPLRIAQKITKGTLEDPILRQFLPTLKETWPEQGFVQDPVEDRLFRKESKLLHKYKGRVLLVCTSACAMHCRYCFRQNFDYDVKDKTFDKELEMIQADPTIHEVILSGGDPLSLSNQVLHGLLQRLSSIPHISRIRFHTRFPIGIPERIDADFLRILEQVRPQVWFVIHCNHPRELDQEIADRLKEIRKSGAVLLNQAVLLSGVNDDLQTMKELCETLVDNGILPYYVHQLDRVKGSSHFEVVEEEGAALMRAIAAELPGYAVPQYVKEVPGQSGKSPISLNYNF